ncbi:hypothetical protein CC86DRAFT_461812 [Ophiobolus disseminans]|uniref:RRM domain-containing protein n=1 Tax=Ophiobolus disseminans TaxID=1469910 RepID=A0A6A7AJP8_9PLEO|nr:hypothetical protein CC86DRAFT_461812 [Ophiobolus disseminans]
MSTSRAFICCSRLASRACAPAPPTRLVPFSTRIIVPQRQLTTSAKLRQETIETPSRGPEVPLTSFTKEPQGSHARSIVILKVPKRAVRADIEKLLQSKGLDITHMQLRLDRFTFHNSSMCCIELASEEQAQRATGELDNIELLRRKIRVKPLREDFVWGSTAEQAHSRYFDEHEISPSEALRPLLEGRRMLFSVQPPGWGEPNSSVDHNKIAKQVLVDHLEKFGIETTGALQPFYGDLKQTPRMLCFLDFKTKGGADQAVQAIHETDIQGRKVWLQQAVLAPWRAWQIGRVDQAVLAELQEKGLASKEPYEDKFMNSDRKEGGKNFKATRIQRIQNRK